MIKQLAKYLGRPCVIVDASSLTKSGLTYEPSLMKIRINQSN
nr:MAG TPA: CodY-like protein [Caudoviricetes sp.]